MYYVTMYITYCILFNIFENYFVLLRCDISSFSFIIRFYLQRLFSDILQITFLRAFLAVPTEEERLSAMIADTFVDFTLQISTLSIALKNARLEVLLKPIGIG